jgi:hypothetical protein
MKTCGEYRYSYTIVNFSIRQRWVVSFTSQSLYPQKRAPGAHWSGGWVGSIVSLNAVEKRKILALTATKPHT